MNLSKQDSQNSDLSTWKDIYSKVDADMSERISQCPFLSLKGIEQSDKQIDKKYLAIFFGFIERVLINYQIEYLDDIIKDIEKKKQQTNCSAELNEVIKFFNELKRKYIREDYGMKYEQFQEFRGEIFKLIEDEQLFKCFNAFAIVYLQHKLEKQHFPIQNIQKYDKEFCTLLSTVLKINIKVFISKQDKIVISAKKICNMNINKIDKQVMIVENYKNQIIYIGYDCSTERLHRFCYQGKIIYDQQQQMRIAQMKQIEDSQQIDQLNQISKVLNDKVQQYDAAIQSTYAKTQEKDLTLQQLHDKLSSQNNSILSLNQNVQSQLSTIQQLESQLKQKAITENRITTSQNQIEAILLSMLNQESNTIKSISQALQNQPSLDINQLQQSLQQQFNAQLQLKQQLLSIFKTQPTSTPLLPPPFTAPLGQVFDQPIIMESQIINNNNNIGELVIENDWQILSPPLQFSNQQVLAPANYYNQQPNQNIMSYQNLPNIPNNFNNNNNNGNLYSQQLIPKNVSNQSFQANNSLNNGQIKQQNQTVDLNNYKTLQTPQQSQQQFNFKKTQVEQNQSQNVNNQNNALYQNSITPKSAFNFSLNPQANQFQQSQNQQYFDGSKMVAKSNTNLDLMTYKKKIVILNENQDDTKDWTQQKKINDVRVKRYDEECPICNNRYKIDDFWTLKCQHMFCYNCLISHLSSLIAQGKRSFNDFTCLHCNLKLEPINVYPLLIEKQRLQVDEYYQNRKINFNCPNINCRQASVIQEKDCIVKEFFITTCCGTQVCSKCKECYHPDTKCQSQIKEIIDQIRAFRESQKSEYSKLFRFCPVCFQYSFKDEGCDHVQCIKCKCEYCFQCSAPRPSIVGHGNHYHREGCQHFFEFTDKKTGKKIDNQYDNKGKCEQCKKTKQPCKRPIAWGEFNEIIKKEVGPEILEGFPDNFVW